MIGEGDACALWAGRRVCAEGGAGTCTRRGSCRSSADRRRTTRPESPHPPLVKTRKTSRPPRDEFCRFGKLSLFNFINKLGPCGTPKIAPDPILDARSSIGGQMRAVNLTDPNPWRPRGPRRGSCTGTAAVSRQGSRPWSRRLTANYAC